MTSIPAKLMVALVVAVFACGLAYGEECGGTEPYLVYLKLSDDAKVLYDIQHTDVIFFARVDSVRSTEAGEDTTFSVLKVLRGSIESKVAISRVSSSDFRFRPKSYYLIKASTLPGDAGLIAYQCGGTFEVPLKKLTAFSERLESLSVLVNR